MQLRKNKGLQFQGCIFLQEDVVIFVLKWLNIPKLNKFQAVRALCFDFRGTEKVLNER